ncbi:hypothetical protein NF212_22570 [Parasalinivibrio latis]|uniref:hypothetical protein n=1 Tax=Parasalinivibrio latis TaxID=2952610 RepID=UPI0030DF4023
MEKTTLLFHENAVRAIKMAFNTPRLFAEQIYVSWSQTSKRQKQIHELKSRISDPDFLKDVGLTEEQVKKQIALLEKKKP